MSTRHGIVLKSEKLNLPKDVAKKLKGKEVELVEVKEGILLRPVVDAIKEARGCLKGRHFSTPRYFQMKKEQKRTER
jgi:hypothetical protein